MKNSDWESTVALDDPDVDQLNEYRSISKFAVLSILAGIGSLLAWLHALMWFVPIIGVLLGFLAFREIRRNDGRTGKGAATLGVSLALILGIGAVTQFLTERQLVAKHARVFAERFLELGLAGEVEHAAQLTEAYLYRMTPGTTRETYYKVQPESMKLLQRVQSDKFVQRLVKAGPDAKVTFLGLQKFEKVKHGQVCGLNYQIDDGDPFRALIVVTRDKNPESSKFTHWQVRTYSFAEES